MKKGWNGGNQPPPRESPPKKKRGPCKKNAKTNANSDGRQAVQPHKIIVDGFTRRRFDWLLLLKANDRSPGYRRAGRKSSLAQSMFQGQVLTSPEHPHPAQPTIRFDGTARPPTPK